MTPETIEREALHILCLVVGSALHFLPDDPALRRPAEAAREAVRLTARELRSNPRPEAVAGAKQTLAKGLAPLAERDLDLRRLYTRATVGKLNCGPLEGKEATTLAELLTIACETSEDRVRGLDHNQRRSLAAQAADAIFFDGVQHIAREVREDWPAMRQRLARLADAIAGLAKHNINLRALAERSVNAADKRRARGKAAGCATPKQRDRPKAAGRATPRKRGAT